MVHYHTMYLLSHWKLGILPSCHQPYLLKHVFILIVDRFSMFSPFPSLFIPHQIFRRWTFVASEAQMQSAVASKRPCKYMNMKSLRSRDLFSLWSQVQALWLLIWWSLEAYMVVNFKVRGISRDARKLAEHPR
jgi:hypothetical protein